MSAQLNNSLLPDLVSKDITSYGFEFTNKFLNQSIANANVAGSFMVNVSHKNAKNTKLFIADENSFMSSEGESKNSAIFDTDQDEINLNKFLEISKLRHINKARREEARRDFIAVRDCYGVIDNISNDGDRIIFEARIYQNLTNEFIEIINAPVDAFKYSDAELLKVGSVFYWKAGYRSTDKGTRVKVNDFNLRRIIREKSIIRKKRVENIVNDLFNIFQNA